MESETSTNEACLFNSEKENLLLNYVGHFRRQYHHLYPTRTPLFLSPKNEFGVSKFVCTTVRPTILPYSELLDWKNTSEFVSDHLNYDHLQVIHQLPENLFSSKKILEDQHGHCFDYANLLCSLLIGNGYNAFIVHGYATREVTLMDTTELENPFLCSKSAVIDRVETKLKSCGKYSLKPTKEFVSKYDHYMKERNQDKNEQETIIIEKTLPDPLAGLRIHSWILVLPGKCHIDTGFFIEPTTGTRKSLDHDDYLGIESVWNHENFWVNMQDCSRGCRWLRFDLDNQVDWEAMFPEINCKNHDDETFDRVRSSLQPDWFEKLKFRFSNPMKLPISNVQSIYFTEKYFPGIENKSLMGDDGKQRHTFELPQTWVEPIRISAEKFQQRYPNGSKNYFYRKSVAEKFSPYKLRDGLVLKISEFRDNFLTDLIRMNFHYEHRHDKLERREFHVTTKIVQEFYRAGRPDRLKEMIFALEVDDQRTMFFYEKSRSDDLIRIEQKPNEFIEFYRNRDDFLLQRKSVSNGRTIIEKFDRNSKDNVEELIFAISENQFHLTFHRQSQHIAASTQTFRKPVTATKFQWSDDLEEHFQVDEDSPWSTQEQMCQQLISLIEREREILEQIEKVQREIHRILLIRKQEELESDLEISLDDIERNQRSKMYRALPNSIVSQTPHDYLAPFLAEIGNPTALDQNLAEKLRWKVLETFKNRAVRQANTIQSLYERLKNNQNNKTDCERILRERLEKHQEISSKMFVELERTLDLDNRLKEPFIVR